MQNLGVGGTRCIMVYVKMVNGGMVGWTREAALNVIRTLLKEARSGESAAPINDKSVERMHLKSCLKEAK